MVRRLVAGAGLAALLIPAGLVGGTAGAAPPDDPLDRFSAAPTRGAIDPAVQPKGLDDDREVTVMVELDAASVAEVEATQNARLSKGKRQQIERNLRAQQQGIVETAEASGGTVLAQTQYALNGVKVTVERSDVPTLAAQPGVTAVHPVATYRLDNAVAIPFLGVPQVWEDTGFTGDGVKVAIIDTGIDYTHADFGGPGTVEAFEAADAADTQPADPALFGPDAPRVKGGFDFVGDDYDAGAAAGSPASVPQPDPNPLDCNGHGSHVAGSAAGGGVNADGTAYTGPYDASTPDREFRVGPGVAPEADLYALRVFGCEGSTDVTVEAIDWAVEHEMDVINMSLGAPYGLKDDASAAAAANAVAAGVVVITSAGNEGPNPYITGSPGSGDGVVATAAVDSTESFPGVQINLPDGSSIPAISANGIIPATDAAHEVVVLENIDGTAENEALGCSVEAFTANGVEPGANQVAVTQRGTCARVARAIFGEQAGAAAVVMINNTADFPPFEGPITENPDDNTPFEVTIPFLGVRGVLGPNPTEDGDQLVAAEGETVTYTEQALENPGFRAPASFSSGGPRNGDSHIKPNVAAPGVSIESAAVGTGNGGVRISGTSMASPMVAGVAALGLEAHPDWHSTEIAAAIVGTADRDGIINERITLTGNGLVDAMQTVTGDVIAFGDKARVGDDRFQVPSLSFGFDEDNRRFEETKKVTVVNKGDSPVTYQVGAVASAQSQEARVTVSPSRITVRPGRTETVKVRLSVDARDIPGSTASDDQFGFWEVSGQVRLSSPDGDLNVPYLLVPRSLSKGDAKASTIRSDRNRPTKVTLTNRNGALTAGMDFYTWGLQDRRDVRVTDGNRGFDLRAAGVQSFAAGDDQLLVFAINNWDRWSNAASMPPRSCIARTEAAICEPAHGSRQPCPSQKRTSLFHAANAQRLSVI